MVTDIAPRKDEMLDNYSLDHLYKSDFAKGSLFTIVRSDEDGMDIELSTKIALKIAYIKEKDAVTSFQLLKLRGGQQVESLTLTIKSLNQVCEIVSLLQERKLGDIIERKTKLVANTGEIDNPNYELLKTFFSKEEGAAVIAQLVTDGHISSHDIVNIGYRRKQLAVFESLLEEAEYWKGYAVENGIKDIKEEKVWQYFFEENKWIFGYGMDYKFKSILQREAHISETDLDGANSVITDFLMGDKFFTTFIEIKKPSTNIFGTNKNRSNCWCLSDDLICAVSQILEHKAAGQIKFDKTRYLNGEPVQQKAYDSKVILLLGHWKELSTAKTSQEREIKKKTFELYRRDSRNIEMLTYDELFERAKFIVEGDISAAGFAATKAMKEPQEIFVDLPVQRSIP